MNYNDQRRLGIKLAKAAKLKKTQATIERESNCFEDILKIAVAEAGVDVLVSSVLQGPPEWAVRTLRYVGALGSRRDDLVKKVAEGPAWAEDASDFLLEDGLRSVRNLAAADSSYPKPTEPPIAGISGMSLFNQGSFNCAWTLLWYDNGYQPNSNYSDWNQWKWSDELTEGKSSGTILLKDFAKTLPKSALVAGNQVWMYVWVRAGSDLPYTSQPCVSFTYDPNTPNAASFTVSGGTQTGSLGYNGIIT